VNGYGQTVPDAEINAVDDARRTVADYLAAYHPALSWTPTGHYLKQRHAIYAEGEPTDKVLGEAGTVKEVHLRVEITPQLLSEAPLMARHERMQERQRLLAFGLASTLGALFVLGGYLRIEEATRSHTRLLRLTAAGLFAAVSAWLWLLR
jgi:hypothetical protein